VETLERVNQRRPCLWRKLTRHTVELDPGNISHASHTLLRTAVLALCALPVHDQTANTGAIAGTVRDPSLALAPGAPVVIMLGLGMPGSTLKTVDPSNESPLNTFPASPYDYELS
jgi:hypothetical protein